MNNIFKAFNVTSQREFDRLIETLKLDGNDTATLFTVLNEDCDYNYLREKVLETAITFGNGSYEKLQKQFEKTPFKRQLKEMPMSDEQYKKLKIGSRVKFDKPSHVPQPEKYDTVIDKSDNEIKTQFRHHGGQARTVCKWNPEHFKQVYSTIDEDTVYDHSWYENEDGKYPKRIKDGVIIEDDKESKNKSSKKLDEVYIVYPGEPDYSLEDEAWESIKEHPDSLLNFDNPSDEMIVYAYKHAKEEKENIFRKYKDLLIGLIQKDEKLQCDLVNENPENLSLIEYPCSEAEIIAYNKLYEEYGAISEFIEATKIFKHPSKNLIKYVLDRLHIIDVSDLLNFWDNIHFNLDRITKNDYKELVDDLIKEEPLFLFAIKKPPLYLINYVEKYYGSSIEDILNGNCEDVESYNDGWVGDGVNALKIQLDLNYVKQIKGKNNTNKQSQPNQIKEGLDTELDLGKILGSMKNVISTTTSMELLNKLFNSLNEKIANAKSDEDIAKINEFKSLIKERVNEINNIGKEEDDTIKECFEYSVPVSPVFNDIEVNNTLEDVFNNIKPATINIEINYEEKTDEDEEEMAKNHMRALASHIGNDVDCCEENRIEELETVNTLLSMLSDYFNKKLGV